MFYGFSTRAKLGLMVFAPVQTNSLRWILINPVRDLVAIQERNLRSEDQLHYDLFTSKDAYGSHFVTPSLLLNVL